MTKLEKQRWGKIILPALRIPLAIALLASDPALFFNGLDNGSLPPEKYPNGSSFVVFNHLSKNNIIKAPQRYADERIATQR